MIGYSKAKLFGQPYRSGYEGEGTGGGWGGWDGGGGGGGQDPAFGGVADSSIAPGAGLSMGPPTASQAQAQAQAFADSLAPYEASPADAVIVPPAKSAPTLMETLQELLPLDKVEISPQPVATVTLDRVTSVDIVQVFNNVTTALLAALGIASGTPAGVVGGARSIAGVVNAPSAFSERMVESVSFGSPAPSIFAGSEAPAAGATFAGADTGGMAGEGVQASPVLGFGGVVIGAPQTTTTSGGTLAGLPAGLASLFAPPGNTRQLYGTVAQQQPAAPAINPAVALAGLAGLIFLG